MSVSTGRVLKDDMTAVGHPACVGRRAGSGGDPRRFAGPVDDENAGFRGVAHTGAIRLGERGKQPGAVRMAQSRALDRLRGHFQEIYR